MKTPIRSLRCLGPLASLALLVLFLGPNAPAADAGECVGCPEPALSDIVAAEGVTLASRSGPPPMDTWWPPARDYMEIDAGDCEFHVSGPDNAERIASWLVLRAYGEVWNCPHSKSSSTITASLTEEDRSDWSVTGTVSASVDLGVAKAGAEFSSTNGGSRGITETTDLSTTISATACRRIPWLAYLRIARYRIEMTVTMVQPYAWWTKNDNTGDAVHQKGTYEQECLSVTVPFERKAPIAWHLRLAEKPCAECGRFTPRDLGWFPKLPSGGKAPAIPEDLDWPDAEPEAPRQAGDGDEDGDARSDDTLEPMDDIVEPNGLPPEAQPHDAPPVG